MQKNLFREEEKSARGVEMKKKKREKTSDATHAASHAITSDASV